MNRRRRKYELESRQGTIQQESREIWEMIAFGPDRHPNPDAHVLRSVPKAPIYPREISLGDTKAGRNQMDENLHRYNIIIHESHRKKRV